MQNRRGVLPATTQIAIRVDTLVVESLRQQAKLSDMDFSEYLRMILSRHSYHADVAREIKQEVNKIMQYSQAAFEEVQILKHQVSELEGKLNAHK
jgi:hypothetical protein